MIKRNYFVLAFAVYVMLSFTFYSFCSSGKNGSNVAKSSDYQVFLKLFKDFRDFTKPNVIDGVPDYSPQAMSEQYGKLNKFQKWLAAIDISNWPVSQQVDYHLVRAEMNGLEFYHRVLRPWSRDPCFYLQSQAGAGPVFYGTLEIPRNFPLSEGKQAELKVKLQAIPKIYNKAKENLREASGDLALIALHFLNEEIAIYRNISSELAKYHPDLVAYADKAKAAVEDYGTWLEENKDKMTEPAGVGVENYNWWMKNVQLVPFTWEELMAIMENEYKRAISALKLEQYRNSGLPQVEPVKNEAEYRQRYYKYQKHLLNFLHEKEILTIPDYLKPLPPKAWKDFPSRQGGNVRDFFEQCEDRNPLPSPLIHEFLGHHFDELCFQRDSRPIRGARRLFAMDMIRSEGLAFGLEEIFMRAGLFDKYPRGREINYIMMAFRAIRALADLKLHSHEFNLKDSFEFCYEQTPYHWMLPDGFEAWYEMETTLRFPGWHMGMVIGKLQLLSLMADRAQQLGDEFNIRQFMDKFRGAGMIPISLIRWEITGLSDEIEKMLK